MDEDGGPESPSSGMDQADDVGPSSPMQMSPLYSDDNTGYDSIHIWLILLIIFKVQLLCLKKSQYNIITILF